MVVFPAPIGPTSAASWPGSILEIHVVQGPLPSTYVPARPWATDSGTVADSGGVSYRNRTWSKLTAPRTSPERQRPRHVLDLVVHVEVLEDPVEQRQRRLHLGRDLQHRADREEQPATAAS